MNPGTLDDRLVLKTPTSSSLDRFGQTTMHYTTASLWCSVRRVNGGETNAGGLIVSNASYIFTIRKRDDVSEKCIITYDNRDYNVTFVDVLYKSYNKLTAEKL